MSPPARYTRLDVDGFSRAVKASCDRASALKLRARADDPTGALAHMEVVVEALTVADEELRVQTDALEEAQHEIELERQRYAALFDFAPDPYIVTDLEGVVTQANRAAETFFRVPSQFLCGKPLASFVALGDRKRFRDMLDRVRQSQAIQEWEIELVGRGATPTTFEAHVARVSAAGESSDVRWLFRDVTKRKQAEQHLRRLHEETEERVEERTQLLEHALAQERVSRARAVAADSATLDFITRLSHELRTPLQAAVGYVDILTHEIPGEVNAAQAAALERIAHAHHHMRALLESLLEIGRVRAGQVALHPTAVPVGEVLSRIKALLVPQLAARRLSLTVTGEAGESTHVRADRTKLEQIVLNLLTNAIRYTPPGGSVALAVSTRESVVAIEVRDTGSGIPRGQLDAIFDPFVRLSSDASVPEGSGLGLSISRDLARLMGGDLSAESEMGRGSTFTLVLPRAPSPDRRDER